MRWFALFAAALALGGPALARPAAPQSPQFFCSSEAHGTLGEGVAVQLTVGLDGKPISVLAVWAPPQVATPDRSGIEQPDLSLAIAYEHPTESAIGAPEEGVAMVQLFSPIRDQISTHKLLAKLNGLTLEASFGDGQAIPLTLMGDYFPLPGTVRQQAVFELPQPLTETVELRLLNQRHLPVVAARFVLSATENRDKLFNEALRQAMAMAQHPAACARQGD